jgi:predicted Zn-ribbon and HTH transcriptional regulator
MRATKCDHCGYTDVRKPHTDCPNCDAGVMLVTGGV